VGCGQSALTAPFGGGVRQGGSLASPALKRERALVAAVARARLATVAALLDDLDGRLPPV
jgi:hypothetical protein